MKRIAVFSTAGIGNTILPIPLIKNLDKSIKCIHGKPLCMESISIKDVLKKFERLVKLK